jgi:hypothetical protein
VNKARTNRRARKAQNKLKNLTVQEVSIVDRPANDHPFHLTKSETPVQVDGDSLVIDRSASAAATAALVAGQHFSAAITKMLTVSEHGRQQVHSYLGELYMRIDELCNILANVDGNPMGGTLDSAIGQELAEIAGIFMKLATAFGATSIVEPAAKADASDDADVSKAGRKMSKMNASRLRDAIVLLNELAQTVMPDEISGMYEKMYGGKFKKSDDASPAGGNLPAYIPGADVAAALADTVSKFDNGLSSTLDHVVALTQRVDALEARPVAKAAPARRINTHAPSNAIDTADAAPRHARATELDAKVPALGWDSELAR